MKATLEKLWDDYLSEESIVIETDEERELAKKLSELRQQISVFLNKEQDSVVEKYAETLFRMDARYAKKAFMRGCEFAVSFLLEAWKLDN